MQYATSSAGRTRKKKNALLVSLIHYIKCLLGVELRSACEGMLQTVSSNLFLRIIMWQESFLILGSRRMSVLLLSVVEELNDVAQIVVDGRSQDAETNTKAHPLNGQ